jgi:cyclase
MEVGQQFKFLKMKTIRIIPRLDIKGPNLVKGIHLEGLRVLGKPADFAKFYYEEGADELIFMDVVASLYERNSLHDIISETAKKIFIPITVGGGLRTISDIKEVLRVGADKVCLNTAAIKNPNLIKDASRMFGSSTIVVAIEAIKESNGKYLAYTDNGREYTGVDVFEWAQQVDELGAGEIVITSVDREGTGQGFDLELVNKLSSLVTIPVIAHGGAGNKEHVIDVLKCGNVSSAMISSLFHYHFIKENESKGSSLEGNVEFLNQKRNFHIFDPCRIIEVKQSLKDNKIECRI